MAGKWSAQETAFLKELLTAHTVREARQKLGRSEYAVRKQMRKLKDSKDPVKYEDMNREDGENIRRMYKRAENKVERLKILKDLYPSYTKETILAAALHNPFRERDKLYEQITKEQNDMAKRRSYNNETKMAVVTDVMMHGLTVSQVSEKHGVPVSNVDKWVRQTKEKQADFMNYAAEVEAEQLTAKQDAEAEKTLNPEYKPRPEPIFKPVEERINEMGYDDPERIALVAELANKAEEKQEPKMEYVCEESRTVGDEKHIKAAAFDEIANIADSYPTANERELLFYINGIIGLAERLINEV